MSRWRERLKQFVLLPLVVAAYVVFGSFASNPGNAIRGILLLLAGVPVFLYWRQRSARGLR